MAPPNIFFFLIQTFLLFTTEPFIVRSEHTESGGQGFDFLSPLKGSQKGQIVKGLTQLKRYLERFGYLNYDIASEGKNKNINATHANDDEFDDLLDSAVRSYQSNYHLNVSGLLDADTINEMELPRCGVADSVYNPKSTTNRTIDQQSKIFRAVSRYALFPGKPRWPRSKTRLTYRFSSSASVVPVQTLRSVCSRALQRWQRVSQFRFQEVKGRSRADIVIGMHRKIHRPCPAPFDGPGGILAHAFAPTVGRFHYDADENWSTNPRGRHQTDLESVAVHEIGHLLGLAHSNVEDAIMYPKYPGLIKRTLHPDDIKGIRTLYKLGRQ